MIWREITPDYWEGSDREGSGAVASIVRQPKVPGHWLLVQSTWGKPPKRRWVSVVPERFLVCIGGHGESTILAAKHKDPLAESKRVAIIDRKAVALRHAAEAEETATRLDNERWAQLHRTLMARRGRRAKAPVVPAAPRRVATLSVLVNGMPAQFEAIVGVDAGSMPECTLNAYAIYKATGIPVAEVFSYRPDRSQARHPMTQVRWWEPEELQR